jgi:flagellar biosynthesis/type III secretory pathway protein FliH
VTLALFWERPLTRVKAWARRERALALARADGYARGKRAGYDDGVKDGYRQGYTIGFETCKHTISELCAKQ